MKRAFVLLAFVATSAFAQSVAVTPEGVLVAHDNFVDLYDAKSLQRISRSDGVAYAGAIVVDHDDVAVLDPIHNRAIVNGKSVTTGETPVDGVFIDHQFFVLERDSRTLSHGGESVHTGAFPQFLRVSRGKLYVYSAVDGLLQEITVSPFAVAREMKVAPFAIDIEIDYATAYFLLPDVGMMVFDLDHEKEEGRIPVGWFPTDITIAGSSTMFKARVLAIADVASKRVWTVQGSQSNAAAFGRGFLRGMLGVHGFTGGKTDVPTGVDRVIARNAHWIAYDSSAGTIYDVTKRNPSDKLPILGRNIGPHAFALGDDFLYLWQNGTLVAQKPGR